MEFHDDPAPGSPDAFSADSPYASPQARGGWAPGAAPVPAAPPKPRVWPPLVLFAIVFVMNILVPALLFVALMVVTSGGRGLRMAPDRVLSDPLAALIFLLSPGMVVLVAAVTAGALSPVPFQRRLRLGRFKLSVVDAVVLVAGVLSISYVFVALQALGVVPESPALEQFAEMLQELPAVGILGAVLVIGILPGIGEEMLFRGYIQTRFTERWGMGRGIVFASALFGIAHVDPVHATFAFLMGLYLGYLTERTGSIRPAIACHIANNTLSVLMTAGEVDLEQPGVELAALVGGLLMAAGAVFYIAVRFRAAAASEPAAAEDEVVVAEPVGEPGPEPPQYLAPRDSDDGEG